MSPDAARIFRIVRGDIVSSDIEKFPLLFIKFAQAVVGLGNLMYNFMELQERLQQGGKEYSMGGQTGKEDCKSKLVMNLIIRNIYP